jgi:hypothetical protein
LPDGIFLDQNFRFGYILEGLGVENFSIFCSHLVNCIAIWYILCSFGIFWCIFPRFGIFYQEKSGDPGASVSAKTVFCDYFRHLAPKFAPFFARVECHA